MVEQYTGGEVIAKMLQMEGVENVFGIIDGTILVSTRNWKHTASNCIRRATKQAPRIWPGHMPV